MDLLLLTPIDDELVAQGLLDPESCNPEDWTIDRPFISLSDQDKGKGHLWSIMRRVLLQFR